MKAKDNLEKAYDHITNQKKDFLHKLSRWYVDAYATICVEDLNIKYLKENGKSTGLRRSIHDASWGRFLSSRTGKETPCASWGRNCPQQAPYTFAPRELSYRPMSNKDRR
ncbi:MAG: IS200/IS605 family accessory protein TnpB-related protein [Methanoculleus sp.]|jgi:IS605 OrfB family transposase|nr:IS200/IS605 family accessory protein TnpB-related protein [Methanoculleus sp.]